jgi:hypothetical protein
MMTATAKIIGEFLIEKELVGHEQLADILRLQDDGDLDFPDAAVESGHVSEDQYLKAVGEFLDIEYRPKIDTQVNSSILSRVPLSFIKENRIVPICEEEGGTCLVAVNDPFVVLGSADVRFIAPVRVGDEVVATAVTVLQKGKKRVLEVSATAGGTEVMKGTMTAFVLDQHVLDD